MGRTKSLKTFELVDVDGIGLNFYFTVEQAVADVHNYWKLRSGWSIWKIEQDGTRKLWCKTYMEDDDEIMDSDYLFELTKGPLYK